MANQLDPTNGVLLQVDVAAHQSEMVRKLNMQPTGPPSQLPGNRNVDVPEVPDALETNNNLPSQIDVDCGNFEGSLRGSPFQNGNHSTGVNGNEEDYSTLASVYQGEWPIDRLYWSSETDHAGNSALSGVQDTASLISFTSNVTSSIPATKPDQEPATKPDQDNTKVEMVCSLLSVLQSYDKVELSKVLYDMSESKESCATLSQSGCLPLIIQLLHNQTDLALFNQALSTKVIDSEVRERASRVLHNIVFSHPDDKKGRRETRVLRLLEHTRSYSDHLRNLGRDKDNENAMCTDQHLGPSVATLMKLSFDEEHRHTMCKLGGLQAIAELMQMDQMVHGCTSDEYCITIRRYAGMALTNLTFGDGANKALLCSMKPFMQALVAQLHSPSEDLRQVVASVLRNLSWRADSASKQMLRDVGAVNTLMKAAMEASKESTLKSILSALWNLSAHCSSNKADICSTEGALAFLVSTLVYKSGSKNLVIVENGGGILRNISSHIAIQNEYRAILRKHNCLQILLRHLKSPSLTVVSNACGTLWNLSARNPVDQRALWEMGAVSMLRKLVNSKHKMISMGSSAALKNLLSAQPPGVVSGSLVLTDDYKHCSDMPSLHVRKQKALDTEIDENLAETYDNTDSPKTSPVNHPSQDKVMAHSSLLRNSVRQPDFRDNPSEKRISSIPVNHRKKDLGSSKNVKYTSDANCLHLKSEEGETENVNCVKSLKSVSDYSPSVNSKVTAMNESSTESTPRVNSPSNLRPQCYSGRGDKCLTSEPPGYYSKKDKMSARCETKNAAVSNHFKEVYPPSKNYSDLAQKIKSISLDDSDFQEQPVNYSLKYSDDGVNSTNIKNVHCSPRRHFVDSKIPPPKVKTHVIPNTSLSKNSSCTDRIPSHSESVFLRKDCDKPTSSHNITIEHGFLFDNYAETDLDNLDQPIDYSKKYKEQDILEDCTSQQVEDNRLFTKLSPRPHSNVQQLTSMTEDSVKVYCTEDTPLNFSSASSLTDLHEIAATLSSEQSPVQSVPKDKKSSILEINKQTLGSIHHSCSNAVMKNCQVISEIDDANVTFEEKESEKSETSELLHQKAEIYLEKEGKTVTFGTEINYAEETPLMFSRCSSLGSLSSFDQQSIQDDRSSVVSDFSRRTSGVVSPSDLPDSPGQTTPHSPSRKKTVFVFPSTSESSPSNIAKNSVPKAVDVCHDASVFDEVKKVYDEEGTPLEFSTASSLSSLSIDNETKHLKVSLIKSKSLGKIEEDNFNKMHNFQEDANSDGGNSVTEEDEKALLAECISSGMPRNKKVQKSRTEENRLHKESHYEHNSGSPLKCPTNIISECRKKPTPSSGSLLRAAVLGRTSEADTFADDSLKIYRTEGTPNLSHSASFSDLSTLSFGDENKSLADPKDTAHDFSSDGSSVCEDEDALLQQCISAGMPRPNVTRNRSLSACGSKNAMTERIDTQSFNSDSSSVCEDDALLQQCINSGMPRPNVPRDRSLADQSPKNIMTGHANAQEFNSGSSSMCEDEDILFQQCISSGMPRDRSQDAQGLQNTITDVTDVQDLNSDSSSMCEDEDALLQQCIKAGMPGPNTQKDRPPCSHASVKSPTFKAKDCTVPNYSFDYENDKTKVFNVENTPVTFSCNDSLSSLSYDDEPPEEVSANPRYKKEPISKDPNIKEVNTFSSKMTLHSSNKTGGGFPSIDERKVEGCEMDEGMHSTPFVNKAFENSADEHHKYNMIEGTPVCFSRSSSLSSLSVESVDELSSTEKALVEECVKFGMPKSKALERKTSVSGKNGRSRSPQKSSYSSSNFNVVRRTVKPEQSVENLQLDNRDYESDHSSENEEKGKEDERNQEKCKLSEMNSVNYSRCCFSSSFSSDCKRKDCRPTLNSSFTEKGSGLLSNVTNEKNASILSQSTLITHSVKKKEQKFDIAYTHLTYKTQETLYESPSLNDFKEKKMLNNFCDNSAENVSVPLLQDTHISFVNHKSRSVHLSDCNSFTPKGGNTYKSAAAFKNAISVEPDCPQVCDSVPNGESDIGLLLGDSDKNNLHNKLHYLPSMTKSEKDLNEDFKLVIKEDGELINHSLKSNNTDLLPSSKSSIKTGNIVESAHCALLDEGAKELQLLSPSQASDEVGNLSEKDDVCTKEANSSGTEDLTDKESETRCSPPSFTDDAQKVADAMLDATAGDSCEDMTVSTLSCLSDIESTKPPSIMGELVSLSMTGSSFSENGNNPSQAVNKILSKHFNISSASGKKHLLKDLLKAKLSEQSICDTSGKLISHDSSDSLRSSFSSDIIDNINPPSVMDDISLTTSTGSLNGFDMSECSSGAEQKLCIVETHDVSNMCARLNQAEAIVQLYTKELSNITGNVIKSSGADFGFVKQPCCFPDTTEISVEDATEVACDTIGSDTEIDELPCDDDDPGSDTLQAPRLCSLSKEEPGEGSTENLTLTLTEEPPLPEEGGKETDYEYEDDVISAEQFKVLQENADLIVSSLNKIHLSDSSDLVGVASNEMLEDETLSLVSNESDEESLSPECEAKAVSASSRQSPAIESPVSFVQLPPSIAAVAPVRELMQGKNSLLLKCASSIPQFPNKRQLSKPSINTTSTVSKRFQPNESYDKNLTCGARSTPSPTSHDSDVNYQINSLTFVKKDKKTKMPATIESSVPKDRVPPFCKKQELPNDICSPVHTEHLEPAITVENYSGEDKLQVHKEFDTRTFTKKKGMDSKLIRPNIPKLSDENNFKKPVNSVLQSNLESAGNSSTNNSMSSLSSNGDSNSAKGSTVTLNKKQVCSKISSVWKNRPKSKSTQDSSRIGKSMLDKNTPSSSSNSSISSKDGDRATPVRQHRSPNYFSSSRQGISRSSTDEKITDDSSKKNIIKRPTTLLLPHKIDSPRPKAVPTNPIAVSEKPVVKAGILQPSTLGHIKTLVRAHSVPSKKEREQVQRSRSSDQSNVPPSSPSQQQLPFHNPNASMGSSNRKSMIPTPSKLALGTSSTEKSYSKGDTKDGRSDSVSTKPRTCLVTMV